MLLGKKKSTIYRELLECGGPSFAVVGSLPIHALLAQKAGADCFVISCIDTALYLLGLPDARLVTMSEVVENAQRVCDAVSLPVIVDCGTGFGDGVNVRRTVEAVIRAGAAGLFIEDQVAPKRCGFVKGKEILPLDEALGKYRAAIDARDELDPDVIIMARTDADGNLEESIRRGKAYKEAGVAGVWLEGLGSREEVRQARAVIGTPLFLSADSLSPPLSDEEMKELGVLDLGIDVNRVGMIGVWDLLASIKERGLDAWDEFIKLSQNHPLGGFGEFDLLGFPKVREWEERYLSPDHMKKYETSLGLYEPGRGSRVKDTQ
ncbi:MAG: PEP phosphonomutase-like protein enzyme [Candidatus Uhrbacteria bacterium GW2011_GWA2_52_8d]|uniref:PEP phosphonomutase-like protein enzyme n=1 Tax=Candidatus Uhrbacteria bacterium GW2011_GWA2_52_8d TaxID=1618979 RepID=A0A0G1XMK6_9BACT|nr:MAG: PEP phosphonomutase-like protein enzyme [Candidatus Uhrbacteria bacterium GW2011_GWA2_52_8d]